MKLRNPTRKGTIWVCVLLIVLAAAAFHHLRYRPFKTSVEALQKETRKVESPSQARAESDRLEKRRTRCDRLCRELEPRIESLEGRFAPKADNASQQLLVDISTLAIRSGFAIEESVFPCKSTSGIIRSHPGDGGSGAGRGTGRSSRAGSPDQALAFLKKYPQGERYKRPLLKIRAETSFAGLQKFLQGLQHLKWRVTPIQFDFENKAFRETFQRVPDTDGAVLEVTLLLAL